MSFQEKSTWVMGIILLGVYGWYFSVVLGQLEGGDVEVIDYRSQMLTTVVLLIVAAVVAHVVIAVANPQDADRTDVRDREINRYGEFVGSYVLGTGALVALGMAMFEVEHFWIANVILAGLVLSELTALGPGWSSIAEASSGKADTGHQRDPTFARR